MKKLVTVALAIALAFSAGTAMAQAEPGDAGIFGSPATLSTTLAAPAFAPFNIYVIAFDLEGDLLAFEAGVSGLAAAGATILNSTLIGPAPLNIGQPLNYIVGTGGCVDGAGAKTLVTINAGFFGGPTVAQDIAVCLGGTTPSSFAGIPGYADCSDVIRTFGVATSGEGRYPDGCLILNATQAGPVSNETASFGDVKARF